MEQSDPMNRQGGLPGCLDYGRYVQYIRQYPDVLDRLLGLWNAFDLEGLKTFFVSLDLNAPPGPPLLSHARYSENRRLIAEIVRREDSYPPVNGSYLKGAAVRRIYSAGAGDYDTLWDSVWSYENRALVIRELDPAPGERILEIGIGTGNNLKHFPPHCHVTGIDFSAGMLAVCEGKTKEHSLDHVELVEMDAHHLRFADARFDKVLCFYTLCCVEDPARVLSEISRVCVPGGTIVVYDVVRSDIPEVQLLQYLYRPIARDCGAIYLEFCPPFKIAYDSWFDFREVLQQGRLITRRETFFDPFRTAILGVYENKGLSPPA